MVSSFYSSNESKQRKYIKENKIRELNQEAQQEIVDDQVATELGLEQKATKLSALSKRITDKLVGVKPEVLRGDTILLRAINNSQLSDLFEKIKLLKDSTLTKTQQSIRNNLSVQRNKDIINSLIQEAVPNGVDAIKSTVINALGGDGNEESVLELITKADKINLKELKPAYLPESKKAQNRENELMRSEDVNVIPKPLPSTPATPAQREALAKAQADLDLISLFQQDVKEARKKQTLKDLDELNEMEDLRLRKKFRDAIAKLDAENNNIKDKVILGKMINAIENQRMADAFQTFSENAITDALASKIQKNLKSALNYKKNIQIVNKYLDKEAIKDFNKKFTLYNKEQNELNDMGKSHNKKIIAYNKEKNERNMMSREDINYSLPIPKSRSNSNTTTEQGSLAGEKLDMRSENKGAPRKPANEKYKEMQEIIAIPVRQRTRKQKKRLTYLRSDKSKEMVERELMSYEDRR